MKNKRSPLTSLWRPAAWLGILFFIGVQSLHAADEMTTNTIYYDVLAVPEVMAPYCTATKAIAFSLLPILFIMGALAEQVKIIKGEKPDYIRLLFNTFMVVFALTFLYTWLFKKIVALCEAIALSMFNAFEWSEFQKILFPTDEKGGIMNSVKNFASMGVANWISNFIIRITSLAQLAFEMVRYVFLCLLYVLGPLAIAAGLNPHTKKMFKGWITNLFQISFWIVVLRIVQGTMLTLNFRALIDPTAPNISILVVANLLLLLMIIFTPILTSRLLSGENISSVGTAVLATMAAAGTAGAAGGVAAGMTGGKGTLGTIKSAMHGVKSAVMSHPLGQTYQSAKEYVRKRRPPPPQEPPTESEESRR